MNVRFRPLILCLCILCFAWAETLSAQSKGSADLRLHTVVIDPGHGGKDPGTMSADKKSMEKTLALKISRMFAARIREAYPEVKVVINYTNDYDDPAKGKDCAIALNDQKADVIFQIASAAGDGVFQAANQRGFYAIGVDSDQKHIDPEVIICSMKKEVGNSIYDAVKALASGDASKWGTTWVADMSNGYVGIGYGDERMPQQVSDELKSAVEEMAKKITSGEIKVETTR